MLINVIMYVLCILASSVVAKNQDIHEFSYLFPTEIVHGNQKGKELPHEIESFARTYHHPTLSYSPFFDTSFIGNASQVRSFHLKPKHEQREVGRVFEVTTDDGVIIEGTFFDRGSDTLIIIGSGFTNEREKMSPFLHLFPSYDIALFDFRGHGYKELDLAKPRTWYKNTSEFVFGVDATISRLGACEEKDVFAVVDGLKTLKPYERVFGASLCYGSFIFLKALALRPGLFDKVIVDGCWESVGQIIQHLRQDMGLTCNPQHGGLQDHCVWSSQWAQDAVLWFARKVAGLSYQDDLSLLNFLPLIKDTPILFFYGKHDLMVDRSEFQSLWSALKSDQKSAIITSNPHVLNHIKQKELYRLISELFFELPYNLFVNCTTSIEYIIAYHQAKIASLASPCPISLKVVNGDSAQNKQEPEQGPHCQSR